MSIVEFIGFACVAVFYGFCAVVGWRLGGFLMDYFTWFNSRASANRREGDE